MIDGMSEICIDCVHQEVCRYECYCPSGHCNDRAVADDFRPKGEWIKHEDGYNVCPYCKNRTAFSYLFCPYCGADMKGGAE